MNACQKINILNLCLFICRIVDPSIKIESHKCSDDHKDHDKSKNRFMVQREKSSCPSKYERYQNRNHKSYWKIICNIVIKLIGYLLPVLVQTTYWFLIAVATIWFCIDILFIKWFICWRLTAGITRNRKFHFLG